MRPEPAWRAPGHKLLQSFRGFLACPVLGTGITLEETGIRYSASVCSFFLPFLSFPPLSVFHTQEYLTDKGSPRSRAGRSWALAVGSGTFSGVGNIWLHAGQTPGSGRGDANRRSAGTGADGNRVLLPHSFIMLAPLGGKGAQRATHWQDFKATSAPKRQSALHVTVLRLEVKTPSYFMRKYIHIYL